MLFSLYLQAASRKSVEHTEKDFCGVLPVAADVSVGPNFALAEFVFDVGVVFAEKDVSVVWSGDPSS